jgi:prevent-host-death family protein
MRAVSISELKAHLSRYLRDVRRGTEVQILDRGVPVARLVGLQSVAGRDPDRWKRLVKAGVLRAGSGDASAVLRRPALRLDADLTKAMIEDRRDRV